jgi:hypothetical protein
MEKSGKYVIELAARIPIRNINFYIDTYRAMSSVDLTDKNYAELKKLESLVADKRLKGRAAIEMLLTHLKDTSGIDISTGMKLLGKFLITRLRQGNVNAMLPFTFLSSAIVEDLKIHKEGPNYEFVEKFLDELVEKNVLHPDLWGLHIRARCERYSHEDLAAIFLGYSIASQGAFSPMIPFPSKPVGFVSALISEVKKLLPRGLVGDGFIKF